MYIQVPARLLRTPNHVNQFPYGSVNPLIFCLCEKVTGSFDPFLHVGIPKEVVQDEPDVGRLVEHRMPL
jgi:hypothetical protein